MTDFLFTTNINYGIGDINLVYLLNQIILAEALVTLQSEYVGSYIKNDLQFSDKLSANVGYSSLLSESIESPCIKTLLFPAMDIAQVLKIADDLMFDSTSKYLDNLQRSIVEGAWEGKSYQDIAADTDRTEGHIRDTAANLWKDISKPIGGKVKKSNFRSTIERNHFCNFQDIVQVETINVCPERMNINYPPEKLRKKIAKRDQSSDRGKIKNRGLGCIPDLFPFYGRDRELEQLEQWILDDDCRLIDIYGMSGIGKTSLIKQLAAQLGDEFERVIWVNLRADRSVVEFIDRDLLPYLSVDLMPNSTWDLERRISILMDELSQHRYLIILDNLQQIFSSGELAGVYGENYQGYQQLIGHFSDLNHQSCILLVGWDEPQDFALLAGQSSSVRSLGLNGLDLDAQKQILQNWGIADGDRSSNIFIDYGGNPLYLNMVSRMIEDCFSGNVENFSRNCQALLTNDIKLILQRQVDRLSSIERQVMQVIATGNRAVSFPDLLVASQISAANLLEVLQSLKRRELIDRQETEQGILFDLQPMIRAFLAASSGL